VLPKEKMQGSLGELWEETLAKSGMTLADVAPGYSELLSVKDAVEVVSHKYEYLIFNNCLF
jgi:hypothetical protein